MVWTACQSNPETQPQTDEALVTDKPSLAQDAPPQLAQVAINVPEENRWLEKFTREVKAKFKAVPIEAGLYKSFLKATIEHTGKAPKPEGQALEEAQIIDLIYEVGLGEGKMTPYSYGSGKGELDVWVNKPLQLERDPVTGKLLGVEYEENLLVDLLGGKWKNGGKEKIQTYLNRYLEVNPTRPMKVGETWNAEFQADWFPHLLIQRTYTIESVDAATVRIVVNGTVSPNPAAGVMGYASDRHICEGTGTETGHIVVQKATGIVLERNFTYFVAGTFTPAGGKPQPMEMEILESSESNGELKRVAPQK
jgi:hypothetical protein